MSFCGNCVSDTPFTVTCPLNGQTTCGRCHDRLCPRLNPPVVDLGKRSLYHQGRKFDLKDVLA